MIVHEYRRTGKIVRIKGKLNSLGGVLQIFSSLLDVRTGTPDGWINWFGSQNETGKLYKDLENNSYWEITNQKVFKNEARTVTRAIITYNVYEDYVWDDDEKKYMGFPKLGTFTEDIDVVNKRSTNASLSRCDQLD